MNTKKQKLKNKTEVAIVAAAVIAAVAIVNYLSSSFFYRIDLTENKQYTVSDATKRVLRNLDDIVTVKAFFSKDLPPETHVTVNTVRDLLTEYKNIAGGKLRVTWEDPAGNPETASMAQSLNVPEITLQTIKRDKAEAMRGYMGIGVMYTDKKESLPVVQNINNLEYDLTQAIIKVKRDSAPKIGVLKTQGADFIPPQIASQMNMANETTDKKFAPIFNTFRDEYDIVAVDVSEGTAIDKDIKTLIIPGGDRFTERTIFEIDQYFMNGGNVIVLANAIDVSFQNGLQANVRETKLLELIEHYGVRVERNMIMDASCGRVQVPRNLGFFTVNDILPYPFFVRIFGEGFAKDNPAVATQSELTLGWASELAIMPDTLGIHSITAQTLVSSSSESWTISEEFNVEPKPEYQMPSKDQMYPRTMAVYISGSFKSYFDGKPVPSVREKSADEEDSAFSQIKLEEERAITPSNTGGNMIVIGDANFINSQNATVGNVTFMFNMIDWLSNDNNLISIRSRTLKDKTINPNILEEGSAKPGMIRLANLLIMPLLVAAVGIAISFRRRERAAPASAAATVTTENKGEPHNEK